MNRKIIALTLLTCFVEQASIRAQDLYGQEAYASDCCPQPLPVGCPKPSCRKKTCRPRTTLPCGPAVQSGCSTNACCGWTPRCIMGSCRKQPQRCWTPRQGWRHPHRRVRSCGQQQPTLCRPKPVCCQRVRCCRPKPSCCPAPLPVCPPQECVQAAPIYEMPQQACATCEPAPACEPAYEQAPNMMQNSQDDMMMMAPESFKYSSGDNLDQSEPMNSMNANSMDDSMNMNNNMPAEDNQDDMLSDDDFDMSTDSDNNSPKAYNK